MGTGMSRPKELVHIGYSNRNIPAIMCASPAGSVNLSNEFEPDIDPGRALLLLKIESFNRYLTWKLKKIPHEKRLSRFQYKAYFDILYPEERFNNLILATEGKKDIKIELDGCENQVYLCKTYLTEITELTGKLEELTILQVCCNYLTRVPLNIGRLAKLKMLIMSKNRITEIPDEIGYCRELKELDLSGNFITTIPKAILGLKRLNSIKLDGNQIKEIPDFIGELKTLKYISLSDNLFNSLPLQIFNLPCLLQLSALNCPLNYRIKYFNEIGTITLTELTARNIIKNNLNYKRSMPGAISDYIMSAKECCFCKGPYFQYYVDVRDTFYFATTEYPIHYRMCSLHYQEHVDRLLSLFQFYESGLGVKPESDHPSVNELFELISFTDNQNQIVNSIGESDKIPLIALSKLRSIRKKKTDKQYFLEDLECCNF